MVMIAKTLNRLRKTLKRKILRRGRKGAVQTFETRSSIAESEIEGSVEDSNVVEEIESATTPRGNDDTTLDILSSISEQASVISSSYDQLPPVTGDQDELSNPNLIRMEDSSNALSSTTNSSGSVPKETPYPWTPPVFDDVSIYQCVKSVISESYFRRQLSFQFHQPLFDGKPYLGEPLRLTESSLLERLTTMEDFDQRVSREKVLLEFCVHGHNDLLSGFIRVANITYHKKVFLRFSYDGWSSHDEVNASHCFSYTECKTDQFSFEFPLRQHFTILEFIIGYETDGCGTYWDNNGGKYYAIIMEKAAPLDTSARVKYFKTDITDQSTTEDCDLESDQEPLLHSA